MHKPKLIVAIYGIGRIGAKDSIHYLELAEILKKDYEISFIEVRNDIGIINNVRSQEFGLKSSNEFIYKDSIRVKKDFRDGKYELLLSKIKQYDDAHMDDYATLSNLAQQLCILDEVAYQIEKIPSNFILCIRDDLAFNPNILAKSCFFKVGEKRYVTSTFHSNAGICERLIFGKYASVLPLIKRKNFVNEYFTKIDSLSYVDKRVLNGEWLFRFSSQESGFKPICAPIFTKRLRSNGSIAKERIFSGPKYIIHDFISFVGFLRFLKLKLISFF